MKRKIASFLLFAMAFILNAAGFDTPKGWFKGAGHPPKYDIGVDTGAGLNGSNAGTIKSILPYIDGSGKLAQRFKAGKLAGHKIRMTGYMKSKDVIVYAMFWLNAIKLEGEKAKNLAYENMMDRPIVGTTDWTEYEIILSVPAEANYMVIGAWLTGTGQIWIDDLKFEILAPSSLQVVKDTTKEEQGPVNLNFED